MVRGGVDRFGIKGVVGKGSVNWNVKLTEVPKMFLLDYYDLVSKWRNSYNGKSSMKPFLSLHRGCRL